jgi:long-subunit fatty acid transport protein
MRFSLGLEYKLDLLTLRGGYYYEGGVVPEETLTPTIPDINARNAISLGLQYDLGPVAWHLSYERILIGDKTVKDWIYNPPEKSYDNLPGKYRMNVSNFMTGLEYHF